MDRTVPAQRWIINLPCDMLFFIGIPLLSLAALLAAANYYASVDIAWFVLAFFAVGNHLPGFMRVYGERELFDRHKAQFLIAPVVIAALVGWSVYNGHLGFFILLALWHMWHFLMQHYGLMRIYEVKQRKPFNLSSRLDWLLLAVWYGYIIIASPHYLINFLERCHRYGFGFYTWIRLEQARQFLEQTLAVERRNQGALFLYARLLLDLDEDPKKIKNIVDELRSSFPKLREKVEVYFMQASKGRIRFAGEAGY